MHVGRTVFAQVMEHFPAYEFQKCVTRYDGDFGKRSFSCLDQFLCLGFAQLTYRESLRDIEACLRSVQGSSIIWASAARPSRRGKTGADLKPFQDDVAAKTTARDAAKKVLDDAQKAQNDAQTALQTAIDNAVKTIKDDPLDITDYTPAAPR